MQMNHRPLGLLFAVAMLATLVAAPTAAQVPEIHNVDGS